MGFLTQGAVKSALSKEGRYRDGEGLMLFVSKPGKASWVVRIQNQGKRRDYGLGSLSLIGLAEARERARDVRRAIKLGDDPHALWKPGRGMELIFRDTALELLESKFSPAGRKQALARLKTYVFPKLGKLQLRSIDAEVIAETLRPIWLSKPETALRTRELIIRVLRYGRPDGPTLEATMARAISDRLPRQPPRSNFAAMPHYEVAPFFDKVLRKAGVGAIALRFVMLTAVRSGEARGAAWSEIDFDRKIWSIPSSRMKTHKQHVVPLSPEALEVLKHADQHRRDDTDLIFPNNAGKMLSDMTLTKVMRDLDAPFTVHGFRSSFRDWAAELTDCPDEVAEAALAHSVRQQVVAAYKRTTFFDKRRTLMDDWGRYAASLEANVVPISAAKKP